MVSVLLRGQHSVSTESEENGPLALVCGSSASALPPCDGTTLCLYTRCATQVQPHARLVTSHPKLAASATGRALLPAATARPSLPGVGEGLIFCVTGLTVSQLCLELLIFFQNTGVAGVSHHPWL